ncbi:hypothetical protein PF003_g29797 [Phytophthora fragariae]|nr:hypothetical protein PF003_g29797 [Phytophthora fragariae]
MKVAVQRQRCVHKRAESHQDEAAVRPSASAVKGKLPSRGGEDYCGAAGAVLWRGLSCHRGLVLPTVG